MVHRTCLLAAAIAAIFPLILSGCATAPPASMETEKVAAVVAAAATAAVNAPKSGSPGSPSSASSASTSSATAAAAAAAVAVQLGQPRTFAEVVKDAKESPGLFPAWQRDDKLWLEVAPDQFDKPFLFTANLSRGIGEQGVYGGMMLLDQIVVLKRIGTTVQLIAKNYGFTGGDNAPMAQAVREGFSDSLLGTTTVVSQAHPERKTVLIDANALLLTDIPAGHSFTSGIQARSYTFDPRNSSFETVHNTPDQSSIVVSAHYANPRATLPASTAAAMAPNPFPPFTTLPDARSLFLGYTYNFAKLPEPMATRQADPRVGHFETELWDFSSDAKFTAKSHFVNRWRLEKQDPAAAMSPPKEPIVFWIDRNVPEKYRAPVRDGILEWNKAFARIGYQDAIVVKQQAADSEFSTYDTHHSTVRWFVSTDNRFAIGPSNVDPRTGEILNAEVGISELWARSERAFIAEEAPPSWPALSEGGSSRGFANQFCTFGTGALQELQFGMDILEARGEIEPGSPEADAFVSAFLKAVVMHEVGHALGLRHNFRGSTVYPLTKISDPKFSNEVGITGSIMDYNPINLAVKGETQGAYVVPSIGPYDYWAIEYAYRPLAKESENEELKKIAARGATDPLLAYSSDEESIAGLDPDVSQYDLGSDPLLYLQKRLVLSRELWQRLESRHLKPGESYEILRRNFDAGFREVGRVATLTAKYVGGVYYVRDFAGTSNLPLTPVAPDKQRAALKLLAAGVFSADSFRFKPEFLRSMGIDYLNIGFNAARLNPDFSLRARVLQLQTGTLNQLMSDAVMSRLLDSEVKVNKADQALGLGELFATLQGSIWSELATGAPISGPRRDLQREHLRRIANVLTRPSPATPADARALLREEARDLSAKIKVALANGKKDPETRAHLAEAANTLDEALKAPLVRQGA